MPALVQHVAGSVDWLDVESAGEMQVALDTGKAPTGVSFAGPGKTDAELRWAVAAGVPHRARVGERGPARGRDRRGPRASATRRDPVNPDFTVKGSGMRWAADPSSSVSTSSSCPPCWKSWSTLDVSARGLPRVRRFAEPADRDPHGRATSDRPAPSRARRCAPRRSPTSTSAAGSASRTSIATSASTSLRSARTCETSWRTRSARPIRRRGW